MSDSQLPEPEVPDVGIPEEDQRELRAEIERVAAENRIRVTDDTFTVSPIRKGYRMPLMVNIGVVVFGAALLLTIAAFFRGEDEQVRAEAGFLASAQGQIVAELRREAEQELNEKDREIAEIEQQLAQVRSDRDRLGANIDERVREREAELEARFEAELEAERARLAEEGLSEEEIEDVIAEIRAERLAEIEEEVAAYRAELEAQREEAKTDLDRQEQQYTEQLTTANEERSQIVAQTEEREQELRAQFEGRLAEQEEELSAAQDELIELSARREREQAAVREITGFFTRIRSLINDRRLDEAQNLVGELRSYLDNPSVRELQTVSGRREADLTLAAALESYIQLEREAEMLRNQETMQELETLTAEYEALQEARDQLASEYEVLQEERNGLEEELAERTAELEAIEAEDFPQQLSDLQEEMETQLNALNGELESRDETIAELESEGASLRDEIASLESGLAEADEQIVSLSELRDRLIALEEAWGDYRENEPDELESAEDPLALSEARIGLEEFLGTDTTQLILPEIDSQINRYFDAFEESGREAALIQSSDLLFELALIDSTEERLTRIEEELESSGEGSGMNEFLQELALLLAEGS